MEKFDAKIVIKPMSRRPDWHESLSPYGYILAEVISAMGKEIRRSNDYEAVFWAHQMAISGSAAEQFLWERLRVIAVEDCGPANPNILPTIDAAMKLYYDLPAQWDERFQVVSYAVCCLCYSEKTHYSNEIFAEMTNRLRNDNERLDMPDYALDYHTRKGKEMGRGFLHFLKEGWLLIRPRAGFSNKWFLALLGRANKKGA